MAGLFGTLNTATKGLHAQQTALQTIGHNVANANTIGYTRQRVTMQADIAQSIPGIGQIGTGVRISGIDRVHDEYITSQLRNGQSTLNYHQELADIIGQLETIFNEPSETGLSNQISEVFNSWTYLASNPEESTAKTMVVQTSETFTDILHYMANQMESLRTDTVNELDKAALDVNSTLKQLESLNHQIWQSSVRGQQPNDLLDQQDRLLSQLSGQLDISVERDQFNRAFVSIDGQSVLSADSRQEVMSVIGHDEDGNPVLSGGELVEGEDFPLGSFVVRSQSESGESTYAAIELESGKVKGQQEALNVIEGMQSDLNDFAFQFATAVNTIHSGDGEGIDFFVFDPENVAGSLRVSQQLLDDPNLVVTGRDLENSISGDGTRAQQIASLQGASLPNNIEDWEYDPETLGINTSSTGSTLFSHYNKMVTEMGITKQQADNMASTQSGLVALLEQRRESFSGVDINEEVVNMIQYSSAFQANSRVLQTISEMLDTLINRTGV